MGSPLKWVIQQVVCSHLLPWHRLGKWMCVCVCLTVIVWWTEGVVSHTPPWGEDDKVSNGNPWSSGFGSKHSKDRWILYREIINMRVRSTAFCIQKCYWRVPKLNSHRMVEGHTVDNHEVLQVVFVRRVVTVPGDHIEWREILRAQNKTNKRSLPKQQTQKALNWAFHRENGTMNNVFVILNSQREYFFT